MDEMNLFGCYCYGRKGMPGFPFDICIFRVKKLPVLYIWTLYSLQLKKNLYRFTEGINKSIAYSPQLFSTYHLNIMYYCIVPFAFI